MTMTVLFTPSCFLGVFVMMAIILFTIPAVSWRLSWRSTVVFSTHYGATFPLTVHPLVFIVSCLALGCRSRCPDSVCLGILVVAAFRNDDFCSLS